MADHMVCENGSKATKKVIKIVVYVCYQSAYEERAQFFAEAMHCLTLKIWPWLDDREISYIFNKLQRLFTFPKVSLLTNVVLTLLADRAEFCAPQP